MEKDLPLQPFAKEHDLYTSDRRRSLSTIETAIPLCFLALYIVILIAATWPYIVVLVAASCRLVHGS